MIENALDAAASPCRSMLCKSALLADVFRAYNSRVLSDMVPKEQVRNWLTARGENLKRLYASIDDADKESARPDFAVHVYPGHVAPDKTTDLALDPNISITNANVAPSNKCLDDRF